MLLEHYFQDIGDFKNKFFKSYLWLKSIQLMKLEYTRGPFH